jgi:hypothetical protein
MKRNLSLFLLLVGLLILVYFVQEKRVEREYVAAQTEGHVFLEPITKLKWNDIDATKNAEGQWIAAGNKLLSHNSMKIIEKKLTELKKMKTITGDWNTFFPEPVKIEVNGVEWTVGNLNLDNTGFYLSKGKEVMVALLEGESQLTNNPDDMERVKLNEFKGELQKTLSDLLEKQLFRFYSKIPLERVVIDSDGRLSFELDFIKNQTSPPPIHGIHVHKKIQDKFVSLLTQVMIKDELPYDPTLKIQMGQIRFMSQKGKEVVWSLRLKNKNSADAYIVDEGAKRTFLMVGGTLKILFIQVQDYWDKKIIPPESFVSFEELPVLFIQGEKSDKVVLKNREPLQFTASKYKVNTPAMDSLFQLVFNLGQFDQAERVSQLSQSERKQILAENLLRMEILGQELHFWRKKEELIVVNLTQGFKAHFNMLDENFHARFEDVLK